MSFLAKIFGGAVAPIVNGVTGIIKEKQRRKSMQVELEGAIQQQRLKNIEAGRVAEVEWNKASISKAGWRPGFLTILLSIPMVLVFIPFMVQYVEQGFEALDKTPEWYRILIGVMVSSAFGVKKLSDYFMNKKFTLGSAGKAGDSGPSGQS